MPTFLPPSVLDWLLESVQNLKMREVRGANPVTCEPCPSFSLWEARAREEPDPEIKTRSSSSTKIRGVKKDLCKLENRVIGLGLP